MPSTALVVTSISAPNAVLKALAAGATTHGVDFIVIGDAASPPTFAIDGCRFYGLAAQRELGFAFARSAPERHYARKNIGYLVALQSGAEVILETDDDNIPRDGFWATRSRRRSLPLVSQPGWVNVYRYFTDANIWPRGLPLDAVSASVAGLSAATAVDCPIQQGLADENPDVDAVYRLVMPLPQSFAAGIAVALGRGAWCPFNSQNTAWWRDAAPLLYLPSYCSFRMTDIWRSFVAQRIAWENGWTVSFHSPDVRQERNAHDLMRDFADEVPGYLKNRAIAGALGGLKLGEGLDRIPANLRACYGELVRIGVVDARELGLLEDWLGDMAMQPGG